MSDFLIDMGLSMEGLTDAQKQVVEAAIPAVSDVVTFINANQALIAEATDLYAKAQPLIAALVKAWGPGGVGAAAQTLLAVIAAKQSQGAAPRPPGPEHG